MKQVNGHQAKETHKSEVIKDDEEKAISETILTSQSEVATPAAAPKASIPVEPTQVNTDEFASALEVGWSFVRQYYSLLGKNPKKLHVLYKSKSTMVHGKEGDDAPTATGQKVKFYLFLSLFFY